MPRMNARTLTHARGSGIDRRVHRRGQIPWTAPVAISAGAMIGALARYAIGTAFPPTTFAWATLLINVAGCLLIGIVTVATDEVWRVHRLVRPFLGVGVLGGFTTFSTYIVDVQRAVQTGAARTGLVYLAATPVGALISVYAGTRLMRRLGRALNRGAGRSRA